VKSVAREALPGLFELLIVAALARHRTLADAACPRDGWPGY
jgi:hypothetical protein